MVDRGLFVRERFHQIHQAVELSDHRPVSN